MTRIVPVILCGGSGTRLWPRSRAVKPKPFLPLIGDSTLFEATLGRCPPDADFASAIVVTGAAHLPHVEDQLAGAPDARVIVEPAAKNTAAAIALAALRVPEDAIMLVCPSDHHIADCDTFVAAAHAAAALAGQGWLVSFGIEAKTPETGYGYLKRGEAIDETGFRVDQFVEKPDRERAQGFLDAGIYAWNGGIFAFRARDFLAELEAHRPAILDAVRRSVERGVDDNHRFYPEPEAFAEVQSESVDYAVMENTSRAAMVPAEMGWSDIGNWQALHEARARDEQGNVAIGHVELVDCRNVLVDSDGPRVSVIGLENVIVVVDGDEVLVTTAAGAQLVGKLSGAVNQ
ncbi:mannose-1-phosphate guanylyltransferase [Novosphingobium sp. JCM 18896]|uniref:mannose-1-phosphate guanylyltransferase n=1 Tax=Novosphingobium sp. JCM 18896 TaxID=2989731 RepID=UPI002223E91E|nr:sugar phosphate nucleotidyltransferase [Novosphingobium sp. JCM 18896]MCW1432073.1 sugar phosphate nucleotidyltransferase [Novosphingobium sp. JCM 18896]